MGENIGSYLHVSQSRPWLGEPPATSYMTQILPHFASYKQEYFPYLRCVLFFHDTYLSLLKSCGDKRIPNCHYFIGKNHLLDLICGLFPQDTFLLLLGPINNNCVPEMSLRNLFGTLRRSREKRQDNDETFKEARKEILNNLREVHRSVKLLPLTSLTNDQAAEYNIRCHDLRLRTDGGSSATAQTYFKPWTLDKLEQFPLDLDDPDTKKSIRTNEACFAKLDEERSRESTGELDPERDDSGLLLSNVFICQFTWHARRNTGDGATLDDLSGWFGRSVNHCVYT